MNDPNRPVAPSAESYARQVAAMIGLDLPDTVMEGVLANLDLLAGYSRLLLDFPLAPACEPASEYRP